VAVVIGSGPEQPLNQKQVDRQELPVSAAQQQQPDILQEIRIPAVGRSKTDSATDLRRCFIA
jgi:hypothetical protein